MLQWLSVRSKQATGTKHEATDKESCWWDTEEHDGEVGKGEKRSADESKGKEGIGKGEVEKNEKTKGSNSYFSSYYSPFSRWEMIFLSRNTRKNQKEICVSSAKATKTKKNMSD